MPLDLGRLFSDPEAPDPAYPPDLRAFTFESGGARLLGCIYVAEGPGPHPTVLLLHGCPGNERNFDLAHALRRAGYNVAVFHYRGAWGSEGRFSLAHVVEDVPAAVAFLRASAEAYRIDPARIVPVGHSMGGFAGLMAAAADPAIPAVAGLTAFNFGLHARLMAKVAAVREQTWATLDPLMMPLRDSTADALIDEMAARRADWNLLDLAPALAGRPVLLVAAERDATAPPALHHRPLVEALEHAGAAALTARTLDADHVFSGRRIALARAVAAWLAGVMAPAPERPES